MSGHSKWANIKNRKGAQDKKRSEAFTKTSKNILTAIRAGGGNTNPEMNLLLKTAIDKAREVNMPKENVERLLTKFEERKANLATYVFEGFGPFGVPLMIEVETDNKNRVLGEVKLIFRDNGGSLGESGSVAFMFDRVAEMEVEKLSEEAQLDLIDSGADDFEGNVVITSADKLKLMSDKLTSMGMKVVRAEIVMRPKLPTMLKSEEEIGQIMDLVESLEENDDVVNVFAGFDLAS